MTCEKCPSTFNSGPPSAVRSSSRATVLLALRLCVLMLGALAVAHPAPGRSLFSAAPSEAARSRITAARIESEWPLLGPGEVVSYVQAVGERLAKAASARYGPPAHPWRFKVVRDRAVTAFAIGGGRIYVSDGALDASQDDAEFATLLAHEMGHQIEGHFQAPETTASGADGRNDLPMGSLNLTVDPANEQAADEISIELLRAAGYDPHAALRVAERARQRLEAHQAHPWQTGRLAALTRLLSDVSPAPAKPSRAFLAAKGALRLH